MGGCQSNKNKKIIRSSTFRTPRSSLKRIYNVTSKIIGKGAFAKVLKGRSLADPNFKVAVKCLKPNSSKDLEALKNEVNILNKLDHPNIVKCYYSSLEQQDQKNAKMSEVFIVTEYARGEALSTIMSKNKNGLSEINAANIMYQLLSAINHCHANQIAHRDIKPHNIIVSKNMKVTLIDFGLSYEYSLGEHMKSCAGSPLFMAPEIAKQDYTYKCDIWSLGILMYVLLSGRLPFYGDSPKEVIANALECDLALNSDFWKNTSPEALDLLEQMINVDPDARPTCAKIMKHEWFDVIKDDTTDDNAESKDVPILDSIRNFKCSSKFTHFLLLNLTRMFKIKKNSEFCQEFKRIDEDNDGMISLEELKNAFDKANMDLSNSEMEDIMKAIDFSGNGKINFTEFLVATAETKTIKQEEYIKMIFDQFDYDTDRKVRKDDITHEFLLQGYSLTLADLKKIFEVHDAKNRGYLEYQDFIDAIVDF